MLQKEMFMCVILMSALVFHISIPLLPPSWPICQPLIRNGSDEVPDPAVMPFRPTARSASLLIRITSCGVYCVPAELVLGTVKAILATSTKATASIGTAILRVFTESDHSRNRYRTDKVFSGGTMELRPCECQEGS